MALSFLVVTLFGVEKNLTVSHSETRNQGWEQKAIIDNFIKNTNLHEGFELDSETADALQDGKYKHYTDDVSRPTILAFRSATHHADSAIQQAEAAEAAIQSA
jgi:hypothetical protein